MTSHLSQQLISNYANAYGCSYEEAQARLEYLREDDPRSFAVIAHRFGREGNTHSDALGPVTIPED